MSLLPQSRIGELWKATHKNSNGERLRSQLFPITLQSFLSYPRGTAISPAVSLPAHCDIRQLDFRSRSCAPSQPHSPTMTSTQRKPSSALISSTPNSPFSHPHQTSRPCSWRCGEPDKEPSIPFNSSFPRGG